MYKLLLSLSSYNEIFRFLNKIFWFLGLKMAKNFDSTLSTIMLQVNGDTEEFLGIVFDYVNRKTDFAKQYVVFAKQNNILAKEKVMQAVDKHTLSGKQFSLV